VRIGSHLQPRQQGWGLPGRWPARVGSSIETYLAALHYSNGQLARYSRPSMLAGTELPPHQVMDATLVALRAGAWADALRLAGSLLARDPLHGGAFEAISAARRALESPQEGGAERRQMTILFADLAGSTGLLRELGGEAYRDLILELHEAAAKAVSNFGGRIGQYLGDGILAYFSYPEAHEDDAARAVFAALDLLDQLRRSAGVFATRFGASPILRVGVDTGQVVIGTAGAGQWTTADSVFGDPTHVAARLQALASANSIVISDATRVLVERDFILESLGEAQLAGYPRATPVHRVVRASDGPLPAAHRPTMCDRETEVSQLERLWSSARAGSHEELLVVGEAGVGKSRLIEHLSNLAVATGGRVLAIHCSSAFRNSPFHPTAAALRRLLIGTMRDGLSDEELRTTLRDIGIPEEVVTRTFTSLASLLEVRRLVDVLPQQLRAAIFEVLLELLTAIAGKNPLLVVVEDLHLADASTAELVRLIQARDTLPLLLVATTRAGHGVANWPRTLELGPLPAEFARELVMRSAPGIDAAKVEQVLGSSVGLPLFLIDLARAATVGPSLVAVPSATTALLTERLDRLDMDSRSLVADLSVLGTTAPYPVLAAVSELPPDRLERALARVLHEELFVACADGQTSTFQFRHPLYLEIAYDRQLLTSRRKRHERCASARMEQHARQERSALPELIAHHLLEAGKAFESLPWWQRAGDRAAASSAHTEALVHYGQGLAVLGTSQETPERAQLELVLQLSYGASCAAVNGYADQRTMHAYTRASELGAAAPEVFTLLPALWGIWAYYLVRGDHSRACEIVERCAALADASGVAVRAVAAAISGAQYGFVGRWQEAERDLAHGAGAAGPVAEQFPHDPGLASRALLAIVRAVRGDDAQARADCEATVTAAATLRGRQADFTRAYVFCYAAWFAQLNDESAQALAWAQQAIAIAQRYNFETWLGAGALHLGIALTELGDFTNGLPLMEQALAGWKKAGAELMLPYFWGRYGRALVRSGKVEDGLEVLRRAIEGAQTTGEAFYDVELRRLHAEALAAAGAGRDAIERELEAAASIAEAQGATAFERRLQRTRSELLG